MNILKISNVKTKSLIRLLVLMPVVLLTAGTVSNAFAGARFYGNGDVAVSVRNNGSGEAMGTFAMVYNDIVGGGENNQYIGCQSYDHGGFFCHAMDSSGDHASCTSDSTFLAQSVHMIAPDARLNFRWNSEGVCTAIVVVHSSRFEDKVR